MKQLLLNNLIKIRTKREEEGEVFKDGGMLETESRGSVRCEIYRLLYILIQIRRKKENAF